MKPKKSTKAKPTGLDKKMLNAMGTPNPMMKNKKK
jgi:hypothetical protein